MGPPTEADLDTSCQADGWPRWRDYLASFRYGEAVTDAQAFRCVRESLINIQSGSLSQWVRIEIPKVGGVVGEFVSAFEKLEDCQTAEYVARVSPDVTRRASSAAWMTFWQKLPKDDLYDSDPAFKGLDRSDKSKPHDSPKDDKNAVRQALERFKGEHPNDDKAVTFAAMMRSMLSAGGKASQGDFLCVATDDPRLNRN